MTELRKAMSIMDYARAKRNTDCVVCQKISPELWMEIKRAQRSARVPLTTILAWLAEEHGIQIAPTQWALHSHGRHTL